MFANWDLSGAENAEVWEQSVDDIAWLLRHVSERFIDGHEYNAYKHGLRLASGAAGIAVAPPGTDAFKRNCLVPGAAPRSA